MSEHCSDNNIGFIDLYKIAYRVDHVINVRVTSQFAEKLCGLRILRVTTQNTNAINEIYVLTDKTPYEVKKVRGECRYSIDYLVD